MGGAGARDDEFEELLSSLLSSEEESSRTRRAERDRLRHGAAPRMPGGGGPGGGAQRCAARTSRMQLTLAPCCGYGRVWAARARARAPACLAASPAAAVWRCPDVVKRQDVVCDQKGYSFANGCSTKRREAMRKRGV